MSEPNIVKVERSESATIPIGVEPDPPGLRGRLVRLGRRLRLVGPPQARYLNCFQMNVVAYRFDTDDDRHALVTVSRSLEDEFGLEVTEAMARTEAVEQLKALTP